MWKSVQGVCETMLEGFRRISPSSKPTRATIDFGLSITVDGNIYVVKASGAASIRISVEWQFDAK